MTDADARPDGGVARQSGGESDAGSLAAAIEAFDPLRAVLYAVLGVMLVVYLIPIETGLVTSFKTLDGIARTLPFLPATGEEFTLAKWRAAWDALNVGLFNSATYAIPATLISGVLGSLTAYGITQTQWSQRLKTVVIALLLAGIFVPLQAVLVPLTTFWTFVGLDSLFAAVGLNRDYAAVPELIVTHVAYGLPICTILFRSYYKNMNEEIVEAARLDGASLRRVYRRIVLPLSTPMFAVVLIYQFTQIWNDLLFALVLIQTTGNDAAPSVLILSGLGVSQQGTDFGLQMAGALLTALPTIAVYVLFADEFSEGVAA